MAPPPSLTWLYAAGGRLTEPPGVGFSPGKDGASHQSGADPPAARLVVVPNASQQDAAPCRRPLTDLGDIP